MWSSLPCGRAAMCNLVANEFIWMAHGDLSPANWWIEIVCDPVILYNYCKTNSSGSPHCWHMFCEILSAILGEVLCYDLKLLAAGHEGKGQKSVGFRKHFSHVKINPKRRMHLWCTEFVDALFGLKRSKQPASTTPKVCSLQMASGINSTGAFCIFVSCDMRFLHLFRLAHTCLCAVTITNVSRHLCEEVTSFEVGWISWFVDSC